MKKQMLALPMLILGSMPALASNFYLAADTGSSRYSANSESDSDTTFSLGAGYQFNQYFSAELVYRDLGEVSATISEDFGVSDFYQEKATLGFTALNASLIASYPLGEVSAIYGRAGVADLDIDADYSYYERVDGTSYSESESGSASKTKAFFGVGYSHSFTPAVALHVEYNRYDDVEALELSTATIGLIYKL